MDLAGLVEKIIEAAAAIGRKGFATRGKAEEGRLSYERGISEALSAFKDAFLVLKLVEDSVLYQVAEQAFPHNDKQRIKGYPRDSYHIAINAHRTRLRNMLRTPGVDLIKKAMLKQRYANLATGQNGYLVKQGKALISVCPQSASILWTRLHLRTDTI